MTEQPPLTHHRDGAIASTTATPGPSAALRAIMDAWGRTGLLSDEIEQLREILRAIAGEAGWLDALALAADHPEPMGLIWALLEEVPDQYVASCAPLLSRLTDLSLPVEPLVRLLGHLSRCTPAADVAAAAAQIAPTSSSLAQRFAMRLLARALDRRPRDQVVLTLRALRDGVIRDLLVIRLAAGQPQALVRDCWSIICAGLDNQTPAWRLLQLAAHVPRAFVIHLAQRAHALANPVETVEVLCALAPRSASPAAHIRSALSIAHNLRTLMRGEPPETIAAAQRQALACVAAALDAAGMGAQHHVRLSAIRQAGLIRSGYERNAALEALQAPVAMGGAVMARGRQVTPLPVTLATAAGGACPHCGATPTVPRSDGLVPICQTCMLGRSTEEAGGGKTAAAPFGARSDSTLATRMYAAIPLWVPHLQELDDAAFWTTWRRWVAEANELPVSEAILYPDANRAEAEQHFTAYAKAIAALSFCDGGVPIFGRRWESRRPPAPNGARAVPTMQPPTGRGRGRAPSTRQRRQTR